MTQCSRGKYIVQPATIWEMWLHFLSGKSTEGVMELLITLLLWLVQQQQQNKHANWPYNYYYVGEQTNTCKTWRPSWKFWSIFLSHVWDNHKILNFHRANIVFMALSWALKNKGSFLEDIQNVFSTLFKHLWMTIVVSPNFKHLMNHRLRF